MSDETKAKRVWILGAGFSRPLGGPLLADLFSMRQWRKMCEVFPNTFEVDRETHDTMLMLAVYTLFHWGRRFPDGELFGFAPGGEGVMLCRDAEDFMLQLETVPETSLVHYYDQATHIDLFEEGHEHPILKLLRKVLHFGSSVECRIQLVGAARRLMAFECAAFHQEIICTYESENAKGQVIEPFIPYQAWGNTLVPGEDVLISFNYDLVVQEIVKPRKGVSLFQLHGTVQEASLAGGVKLTALQPYANLTDQIAIPNIKVPGRSKARMTDEDKQLWNDAGQRLEEADRIIFMGYGLPESDSYARQFFLKHLRKNESRVLDIEIVLGEPNFRTDRLKATIEQALAHRSTDIRMIAEVQRRISSQEEYLDDFVTDPKNLELSNYEDWKEQEEEMLASLEAFRGLNLTVRPQYAQDYMQAYATHHEALNAGKPK